MSSDLPLEPWHGAARGYDDHGYFKALCGKLGLLTRGTGGVDSASSGTTMAEACLPAQTPMAEALTFVAPEAYPVSGERMPLNAMRIDELSLVLYRFVSSRFVSSR